VAKWANYWRKAKGFELQNIELEVENLYGQMQGEQGSPSVIEACHPLESHRYQIFLE
jgi:hypothetical protein